MIPVQTPDQRANATMQERAMHDKDKIKKLRKSPDVSKLYGLKIGTANFYFSTAKKRKDFWEGTAANKGYKEQLIRTVGKNYVESLTVENFKKDGKNNTADRRMESPVSGILQSEQ